MLQKLIFSIFIKTIQFSQLDFLEIQLWVFNVGIRKYD
jgi:hypothetical protein